MAGEIARSLTGLMALPAPTVSLLLGEGTGGAALALLPADRVLCAEHAWLSPLPPEGASAIVHRTTERAAEMAAAQGVRSRDLLRDGIVDVIVPEEPDAADEPAGFCAALDALEERPDPRSSRSTTTFCGSATRASAPSSRPAGTWRRTWPTGWSRTCATCCRGCANSPGRCRARRTPGASTTDGARPGSGLHRAQGGVGLRPLVWWRSAAGVPCTEECGRGDGVGAARRDHSYRRGGPGRCAAVRRERQSNRSVTAVATRARSSQVSNCR
jgi:hypothetical protein